MNSIPPMPPDPLNPAGRAAAPPPLAYESPQGGVAISIGSIAVKLLGVYCIVLALPVISYIARSAGQMSGPRGQTWWMVLVYSPYIIYAGAAVVLIRGGDWIAIRLFGRGAIVTPMRPQIGEYWQALAFSLAAILTLLHAIPNVGVWIYVNVNYPPSARVYDLVIAICEVVLGLVLFLGSKGLARFWHRLRTADTPEAQSEQNPA